MISASISDFSKELYANIDRIWEKPPDEIKKMKEDLNVPRMYAWFKVNYTFHQLKSMGELLSVSAACANEGMSLDTIKAINNRFITHQINLMKAQGLEDTVKILMKAGKMIDGAKNVEEYLAINDPLRIYVAKMGQAGWLDHEQYWSEMSSAWNIIDSLKGG